MRTTALARVIEDDPDFVLSETGVRVKRYSDDRGAPRLKNHVELVNTTTNVGKETRTVKKTADLLTRLYANGDERKSHITLAQKVAGTKFTEEFHKAGFNLSGRTSFEWLPKGTADIGDAALRARKRLYAIVERLGGLSSLQGSMAMNVLGWGMTLQDWSKTQHNMADTREARGVLRATLDSLVDYWCIGEVDE